MSSSALGKHHRLVRPTSRTLILLLLALFVAICGVIDQHATRPLANNITPAVGAAPVSAVSSAWYCPLLSITSGNPAGSSVTVLNPQNQALSGTMTIVDVAGKTVDVPVNVAPRTRQVVNPGQFVDGKFASALVRLSGGGAAVEEMVSTGAGIAQHGCSSTASDNWYFADGSTESGADLQIAVFNPFNENAILDASFTTSDQDAQPQAFQGVLIPPLKMAVLDVSGNVRRRDWVATHLSLRSGRVVAAELQTGVINGNPVAGYTIGQPALSLTQYVPDLQVTDGRKVRLAMYNPTAFESEVQVSNQLDSGNIQPFTLHIPASSRVDLNLEGEQRIAKGTKFGAIVKSTNGVPIATQLTTSAVAPAATSGGSFVTLPSAPAKQWMFANGSPGPGSNAVVFIENPGDQIANYQLTLTGDGNSSTQVPAKVEPGRRVAVPIGDLSPNGIASIVVTSDQPVVVSREIDLPPGPNLSIDAGAPVRE